MSSISKILSRIPRKRNIWVTLAMCLGCSDRAEIKDPSSIQLVANQELHTLLQEYVDQTPGDFRLATRVGDGADYVIELTTDLGCSECYEVQGSGHRFQVQAGDELGLQYGLSALLEAWGYRFHHPFDTVVPDTIPELEPDHPALNVLVEPDMAFRSLHMHTLHPIEGLKAFWMGGEGEIERAKSVVDWVVKNRGNDLQWVSLDDVMASSVKQDWVHHSQQIVAYAHGRKLTVGLGIQLFGSGNLQQAFDLLDQIGDDDANRMEIEKRLMPLSQVGFDRFNLSFGEFFGEDPETFVSMVNLVGEVLASLDPHAVMTTLIHVGDSEDQRVVYGGEEMIYYFLAQFADPDIVPWVHTVMLYNLFEDAGGAYHHDEFDEHRAFFLGRVERGEPTAYFPESAYWIAFDNSVPIYLPAYMRSRWLDMDSVRSAVGPMPGHILFSSGWEWGYWQTDVATLRMNHSLDGIGGVGPGWTGLVRWMYAPWGDAGEQLAEAIIELGSKQADALINERLMAYFAGRDATLDIGEAVGVVAQPPRVRIEHLDALDANGRAAFVSEVLLPLRAHVDAIGEIEATLPASQGSRWLQEVRDGVSITHLRGRYVLAIYTAALDHLEGRDPVDKILEAEALLSQAHSVVNKRHENLHDPQGKQWLSANWENPTIYQFGYLFRADELCFWERERAKLMNLVAGSTVETVPGCSL